MSSVSEFLQTRRDEASRNQQIHAETCRELLDNLDQELCNRLFNVESLHQLRTKLEMVAKDMQCEPDAAARLGRRLAATVQNPCIRVEEPHQQAFCDIRKSLSMLNTERSQSQDGFDLQSDAQLCDVADHISRAAQVVHDLDHSLNGM